MYREVAQWRHIRRRIQEEEIRQADRVAQRSVEAAANDCQKAVTLALDVEPLLNEADILLTAATIIIRQCKESDSATA